MIMLDNGGMKLLKLESAVRTVTELNLPAALLQVTPSWTETSIGGMKPATPHVTICLCAKAS